MKTKILTIILLIFSSKLSANENIGLDTKIFKNLRCLVCQGQTIAESNSDFAQTIKIVVRDKISQGSNEKEIYEFLSEKYGESQYSSGFPLGLIFNALIEWSLAPKNTMSSITDIGVSILSPTSHVPKIIPDDISET